MLGQPRSLLLGIDHLLRIRHDQLRFYADLRAGYGDRVRLRLGPYRSWLLFHPRDIEAVLVRHASSFIRFRKLTRILAQWNGDSLVMAEGQRWRDRRRKVQPAFQTRRMTDYAAVAVDHALRFCERFDGEAQCGTLTIDTDVAMARLTLDIATGTLFGAPPLDNGDTVERAIQILSETAFRESTSPFSLPDWLPLAAKTRKRWAIAVMGDVVSDLVSRRLAEPGKDRGDLLSMLIEQHDGDFAPIRDDAMSLLIAGHETSGALLSWMFLALVEHPDWRARVIAELSEQAGRRVTVADLPHLPLLRAVLAEVLRVRPPAYALFLRQATDSIDLDGMTIARNELVQIVPYTVHRDPRWFPDPECFDPCRFLGEPTWPVYAYLPFGTGPRVCIGQNFALIEAALVAATILQRWEPVSVPESPTPEPKFSLRPKGGLKMTWRRR